MKSITIMRTPQREELRSVQLTLSRTEADEEIELALPSAIRLASPLMWGLLAQTIITWGLTCRNSIWKLPDIDFDEETVAERARTSEHHLLGLLLASRVVTSGGADVSAATARIVDRLLRGRNLLSQNGTTRTSIILPAFIPRLARSIDLHAFDGSRWSVEEEARSLYHDIWPERDKASSLRSPLLSQDEKLIGEGDTVRIARTKWPEFHPAASAGRPFVPLGARTMTPSHLAADLISKFRIQPKPITDEIGEVLFELVQNTEWHAAGRPGGVTGRNVRVISFERVDFHQHQLAELEIADPGFAAYVGEVMRSVRPRAISVSLGMATVIDSGIGLARTVAERSGHLGAFDETTEIGYLKDALEKTTRLRRRELGGFIGLARVQQLLTNLKGFMYVRSGNAELRRDFAQRPFEPIDQTVTPPRPKPSRFLDWIPDRQEDFIVGDRVGTDVTFVVPLDLTQDGPE